MTDLDREFLEIVKNATPEEVELIRQLIIAEMGRLGQQAKSRGNAAGSPGRCATRGRRGAEIVSFPGPGG